MKFAPWNDWERFDIEITGPTQIPEPDANEDHWLAGEDSRDTTSVDIYLRSHEFDAKVITASKVAKDLGFTEDHIIDCLQMLIGCGEVRCNPDFREAILQHRKLI
jgi:hypothetical protein